MGRKTGYLPEAMSPVVYALLCVAVPIGWGLVVVGLSNWIERVVRRRTKPAKPLPPTEYYI